MKMEFEWAVSDPDEKGLVTVRVHVVGTDITSFFGPMPQHIVNAFVRAKRAALDRTVRSNLDAIKILSPNYPPIGKKPQ